MTQHHNHLLILGSGSAGYPGAVYAACANLKAAVDHWSCSMRAIDEHQLKWTIGRQMSSVSVDRT